MSVDNTKPYSIADLDAAPRSRETLLSHTPEQILELYSRINDLSAEKIELIAEISHLKTSKETNTILNQLIKPYAFRTFIFMCVYCFVACGILIADGLSLNGFSVHETVLGYLVGSTAATVIGLVTVVLAGIFIGARK